MATKRFFILLGLTTVLWCGIWLWPEHKLEPKPITVPWIEATVATVKRLDLAPSGIPPFSLINEDGRWYVFQTPLKQKSQFLDSPLPPLRMHADRTRVEAILTLVGQTKPKRSLGPTPYEKIAEFGLDKPTSELTIDTGQFPPWSLRLGAVNPTGDSIFAQASTSGEDCLLLDARYREELTHKAETFYDKRIFEVNPEVVSKVRLENSETKYFELTRSGTSFTFTWPEFLQPKAVATTEVDSFLRNLAIVQVLAFMSTPPVALPKPYLKLSVWTAAKAEPQILTLYTRGTEQQMFIGKTDRHAPFFSIDKDSVARLAVNAFSLRERSVFTLNTALVHRQRLTRPATKNLPATEIIAERTDKGWQKPDKKDLPGIDVSLWHLNNLKYTDEPVPMPPKTAVQALIWELSEVSSTTMPLPPLATLEFLRDSQLPASSCWVRVIGQPNVFSVSDTLLEELLLQFRETTTSTPTTPAPDIAQ